MKLVWGCGVHDHGLPARTGGQHIVPLPTPAWAGLTQSTVGVLGFIEARTASNTDNLPIKFYSLTSFINLLDSFHKSIYLIEYRLNEICQLITE